ncbi:non-ribosomal peptide synthetase [Streptomyces antioxidans]|uniref:Non-ribosomal peptide synthetase n=1 Tax=Streptomyces antioxidans TaxID=1507734 RepID=A0A1V4DBX6_9ACTN|nr:non-ribosomal peptide synthetase [Streptomyces antioxidans]OPF83724.1 non-ribosomal peptide synthetase [Streptomyces antioxidans]
MSRIETPLSFGQQRIWFVEQVAPGNVAYINPDVRILRGALVAGALDTAVRTVVERHDALRTRITPATGGHEPMQWVEPQAGQVLDVVEMSAEDISTDALRPDIEAFVREAAGRPFDLASESPMRVYLLRWSPTLHALVVIGHHIALDGWSLTNVIEEIALFYNREVGATDKKPREVTVQYPEFAAWQREHLNEDRIREEATFWRDYLEGAPAQIELPWDRPRPERRDMTGSMINLMLPDEVYDAARQLASTARCTLYMVLAAALSVVLTRYSDQRDVVLGTPVAGRTRTEFESTVGLFLNLISVRVPVDDDASFLDLLKSTRSSSLKAMQHQELPFDQVLQSLPVRRQDNLSPVFQVSLSVANLPDLPFHLDGLEPTEHLWVELNGARYDLTTTFVPEAGRLRLRLQYDTARFDRSTMLALVSHLGQVLLQAAGTPTVRVADLDLASQEEKNRVGEFSGLGTVEAAARPVPDVLTRFGQAVQTWPDRIAARSGDGHLTFRQLNREADAFADALAAEGIGHGDVVAVRLPRGLDFLATVLGVWKLGAVFLPLDAAHPAQRVAFILEDANARLVVSHEGTPALAGVRTVSPAGLRGRTAERAARPDPETKTTAYIMYTSGSTGDPKGVAVARTALSAFCEAAVELVGITPEDVSLSLTTTSFDISLLEYLVPLLAGASVQLLLEGATSPAAVGRALSRTPPVTYVGGTPTVWKSLREAGVEVANGTRLMLGGEPLPADFAAYLDGRGLEYWNFYGPTEATVYCTVQSSGGGGKAHAARVETASCVGVPFGLNRAYVLNASYRPCPVNVPGEIFLAGPQVAQGYVGQPELTASRFPLDRIAADGYRRYRTGDAGRWDAQGRLRFLGRLDTQVKVRGFRVELEEIEKRLAECPGAAAAVVGVDPEAADRLIAGIIPEGDNPPDAAELREHLSRTLPAYMIPSRYVRLDALPMSASGKLDRRGLADTTRPAPVADRDGGSPHEHLVRGVFRDLLGRDDIGRDSHFFDLGGHSLLAVQMVLRFTDMFGVTLETAEVFRYPTPRTFAERLGRPEFVPKSSVPLRAAGGEPTVICLPPLSGTAWSFVQLLPYLPKHMPVHGVLSPILKTDGRSADPAAVLEEFLSAVQDIDVLGPVVLVGWSMGAALAPAVAAELHDRGHQIEHVVMFDAADVDLAGPPPQAPCGLTHFLAADRTSVLDGRYWEGLFEGQTDTITTTAPHLRMLDPDKLAESGPHLRKTLIECGD